MLPVAERPPHVEAVRAEPWSKYWTEALIVQTVKSFHIAGRYTEADYQALERRLEEIIPDGAWPAYRMTGTIEGLMGSASGVYPSSPDIWTSDAEVIYFGNIEYSLLVVGGGGDLVSDLRSVLSEVRMPVQPTYTEGRERHLRDEELAEEQRTTRLQEIGLIEPDEWLAHQC